MKIFKIILVSLRYFIQIFEKIKINHQLKIGYQKNSYYYLLQQKEWKHADTP